MARTTIVGNWKMHGSTSSIEAFAAAWTVQRDDVDVVLAPPYPYLGQLAVALPGVGLAAQDCSAQVEGAFTGEVAAGMLADMGCGWVILGHSERRQYHAEASELVAVKLKQALNVGLKPIVCVGETLEQRRAGEHEAVVTGQLLASIGDSPVDTMLVAYEPVWAIGTGETATPEQADSMHAVMRQLLTERFGEAGAAVPLLYGGSVKPGNAAELFGCEHIDGALVGGASLKAPDFGAIVDAA
jgi:triosephosphate isomerase